MDGNVKLIVGGVVASLVIVVGGSMLLTAGQQKPAVREELGSASMAIDKTAADLGSMNKDEERTAVFSIENTGSSALRIWNVSTSCDCTFAVVKIGEKETGEFNMPGHMAGWLKNWIGEVPAGQKAILSVIYRPKVMPVVGKISRQVSFYTNDPKNEKVEVSIEADVQ